KARFRRAARWVGFTFVVAVVGITAVTLMISLAIRSQYDGDRGALVTLATIPAIAMCLAIRKMLVRVGRAFVLNAGEVLSLHGTPRRPVLFLRAFADDEMVVSLSDRSLMAGQEVTFEEIIAQEFAQVGPVIAIGRPGERSPPPGAARL